MEKSFKILYRAEVEIEVNVLAENKDDAIKKANNSLYITQDHYFKRVPNDTKVRALNPILVHDVKDMAHENRVKNIRDFVGEGGLIAFEHGFNPPFVTIQNYPIKIWGVTDTEVCLSPGKNIGKKIVGYRESLSKLSDYDLDKIYKALKEYYHYCLFDA